MRMIKILKISQCIIKSNYVINLQKRCLKILETSKSKIFRKIQLFINLFTSKQ